MGKLLCMFYDIKRDHLTQWFLKLGYISKSSETFQSIYNLYPMPKGFNFWPKLGVVFRIFKETMATQYVQRLGAIYLDALGFPCVAGAESPWRCETVISFPQQVWENPNFLWPLSGIRWASLIILLWDKHVNHIGWVNSDGLNEWIYQSINPDSRLLVQIHLHHPLIMNQCSSLTSPGLSFPLCENWFTRSPVRCLIYQILGPYGQENLWDPI